MPISLLSKYECSTTLHHSIKIGLPTFHLDQNTEHHAVSYIVYSSFPEKACES
uniref:Uncharacterized protein n=1 Tax=Arundo donax TaxID=35708 RepID=A0A0A9G138_ARUDO